MSDWAAPIDVQSIAVVGMAGQFPGSPDVDNFWRNLRDGLETITFFREEELKAAGLPEAVIGQANYVPAKGLLADAELFDAGFFGYAPCDAEMMDPQHRIFLECAWQALENAGYDPLRCEFPVGVFAGSSANTYSRTDGYLAAARSAGGLDVRIGSDRDFLATRVSYKLNLKGPSMVVQTACSTSLVAVCQACQALADYQCDMALGGGVSVGVPRIAGYFYQEAGIASPDGHCRPFDANSKGTLPGEGVGIVVLKRLADALADGDAVVAVIRGWALNNDGSGKIGYTAPSVTGQADVIAMAHSLADVRPESISYVETHGTATALGDPIEIAGLMRAFGDCAKHGRFCGLGSVKGNMGHLDAAAGVAGLMKTILALKHQELPPSLNFHRPNPDIPFEDSPFYVNAELRRWDGCPLPRRAGVSSFGIGGTNAHVVLEEAPQAAPPAPRRERCPILLSARSAAALEAATTRLGAALAASDAPELADVAYTLSVGRHRFAHRRMLVCTDVEDALAALDPIDARRVYTERGDETERDVAFQFPGQGAQYAGMGRELHAREPVFREFLDHCAGRLKSELGVDLRTVMFAEPSARASQRLQHTELTQPALFTVEYALARQLMAWGVEPAAMIGHSVGEYVAACIAGVLSLDDALRVVAARGRLMQACPAGSMMAVMMRASELEPLLDHALCVAAINESDSCVVSGPDAAVSALESSLVERAAECQHLRTSHAFHSPMMEPALAPFEELLSSVELRAPTIPFISNLTGTWIAPAEATDPNYWTRHLRETVRYADGIAELLAGSARALLEVGPGNTLTTLARRYLARRDQNAIMTCMGHPRDERSEAELLVEAVGRLWAAGVNLDWASFHGEGRKRVALPTYPFERKRYWIAPYAEVAASKPSARPSRRPLDDWFHAPSWHRSEAPSALAGALGEPRRWLMMADDAGVCDAIAGRLRDANHEVVRVRMGATFEARGDYGYSLAPDAPEHFRRLVFHLSDAGWCPHRIVYAWGLGETGDVTSDVLIDRCLHGPVALVSALEVAHPGVPVDIVFLTSDAHEVTGLETIVPEKAALAGPCLVVPREHPHIGCRSIDLVAEPDWPIDDVLAEIVSDAPDRFVAYRGGHRWRSALEPLRLQSPGDHTPRLRERGVYMITGAFGGIGQALARHMARAVSAKLVLVARTPLPPPGEWDAAIARPPGEDVVARRLQVVRELEELGAEVMTVCADVADARQMHAAVSAALQRFGVIHGAIHSAGVPGGGLVAMKTREAANAVLAPKVRGALTLEAALEGQAADFLVLCSSLAALIGPVGQVDYTAANAFLDAFAQSRRRSGGRYTVAVDWDTWSEVGMAVDAVLSADLLDLQQERLALGIRSSEGVEALRRILGSNVPQVVVSTRARELEPTTAGAETPVDEAEAVATTAGATALSGHERPSLDTEYVAPRNETEAQIAGIWSQLLGIDRIGAHDNFLDLGGHSLLATRLLARLRIDLNIDLTLEDIFVEPTVAGIAQRAHTSGETPTKTGNAVRDQQGRLIDNFEPSGDGDPSGLLASVYAASKSKPVTRQ